jgi:trehalose 6-phosphate synthase
MPGKSHSDEGWLTAYQEVNETFADTIVPHVEDGDAIWIHDYHLLLLPAVLRQRLHNKKDIKIGLFLHTPFPSEDHFSILQFREAICNGLLSCDLVGSHIDEYAKDFLDSAQKVLKYHPIMEVLSFSTNIHSGVSNGHRVICITKAGN